MMMTCSILTLTNLEETASLGNFIGKNAKPGDIVCLGGDLGAGKTALTQEIAKGLDVPPSCYVTSPTFAILQEYPGRIPLYHMDFYRLADELEVEESGFDEFFYLSGITVIEWYERAINTIPDTRLLLRIRIEDNLFRKVEIDFGKGDWEQRFSTYWVDGNR